MKLEILKELLQFIFENKKWWIGSLLILLVLLGLSSYWEKDPLSPH
jgi:hypothetical protein